MSLDIKIPIKVKCPHCGMDAVCVELPIPIDKFGEILKSLKK